MLTETRFRDLYQLSRNLAGEGAEAASREVLFLLFDRGQDAGGYGVTRLTFVLRDLAGLAGVGVEADQRGREARRTYQGLVERRDRREERAVAGDTGFSELQELVALNRALGESERSYDLFRRLQSGGDGNDPGDPAVADTLGRLLQDELSPRDPRLLVEEILRQRLRGEFHTLVTLAEGLAERHADRSERRSDAGLEHDLRQSATRVRTLAGRLRADGDGGGADGDGGGAPDDGLAEVAWKLTDPRRLASAMEGGEKADVRLAGLAGEGRDAVERYGVEADNPLADDLHDRVMDVAAEVAESISELRVREDFDRRRDDHPARRAVQAYAEQKVRRDGLLVYEILLRLGETDAAERMAAWLLAYRQDEDMYLQLIQAARRSGRSKVEADLNEEAQRVLVGG